MEKVTSHSHRPSAVFDGGNLDCGNGLLLLIRKHLDVLQTGQLLEMLSTESSVEQDLPAWCRLTNNTLMSWTRNGNQRSFLICKGQWTDQADSDRQQSDLLTSKKPAITHLTPVPVKIPQSLPLPGQAPLPPPLAVTTIGSWPRPAWLMRSLQDLLSGSITENEFQMHADDAVRLCLNVQLNCGVDLVTDGEQRRDSYSTFVANRLDNCMSVPLTDLFPLVENPDEFKQELAKLQVPAEKVTHPIVFGLLGRSRSLAVHEFNFVSQLTSLPVKVALPGPYLLARTMWTECISEKAYESRDELARDIVRVLKEEIHHLLAAGVSIVQLDEPVLTEVVFGDGHYQQTFMCGTLGKKLPADAELDFAAQLLNELTAGLPANRIAMHVCRGNWSNDENVALSGSYKALLPFFQTLANIGTLFLEFCTPRAGDLSIIKDIPDHTRIGIGCINPKNPEVEAVDSILAKVQAAIDMIGHRRLLLVPDCGFATFAHTPVCSAHTAELKLKALVEAAREARKRQGQSE